MSAFIYLYQNSGPYFFRRERERDEGPPCIDFEQRRGRSKTGGGHYGPRRGPQRVWSRWHWNGPLRLNTSEPSPLRSLSGRFTCPTDRWKGHRNFVIRKILLLHGLVCFDSDCLGAIRILNTVFIASMIFYNGFLNLISDLVRGNEIKLHLQW